MGLKAKLKEIFIDNSDLDIANARIGDLMDLCDSKSQTIAYQKELLNIQGESIKELRRVNEELLKIKEEIINDNKRNTSRKSTNSRQK